MKILHTSDWHLGQHFMFQDRIKEHEKFLDWLLTVLENESIDVLIISGDIFDSASPPNYALKLYFQFLAQLSQTHCKKVVIIGGNHDSVATLNASRLLLETLDIHVTGGISENIHEQIVSIDDKDETPLAIVCAVPFLRDKDIRKSLPGETWQDKSRALAAGIKTHYEEIAKACIKKYGQSLLKTIPVIATGHLFAAGGKVNNDEHIRDIHVGNIEKFNVSNFPETFDYVALGHLHTAQKAGQKEHIRYSGSPIPLSFGETASSKKVLKITFLPPDKKPDIESIPIPCFQKLIPIRGSLEDVLTQINIHTDTLLDENEVLWMHITITGAWKPFTEEKIREKVQKKPVKIFAIKRERSVSDKTRLQPENFEDLDHLTPNQVFEKRLDLEESIETPDRNDMIIAFNQILQSALDEL